VLPLVNKVGRGSDNKSGKNLKILLIILVLVVLFANQGKTTVGVGIKVVFIFNSDS